MSIVDKLLEAEGAIQSEAYDPDLDKLLHKAAAEVEALVAVNAELLAVVRAQGVHHDIVSLIDVHLPEMPQNWRPFLSDLAKRAAANIARADAAIAKAKGGGHDAR